MSITLKKIIGDQGEQAVVDYLQKEGHSICARNFRITAGEIDIVACKENIVSFIEVKTRNTVYFPLSEIIVPTKQRKIIAAARQYIFRHNVGGMVYRFDVALLSLVKGEWDIMYIKNAFTDMESFI